MEITLGSWRLAIEQVVPTVDELSEKYNTAAPSWHQSIQRMGFIEAYRSIFAQMQQSGRLHTASNEISILDVGVGTGGLVQAFLDEEPRPVHLTGVDISTEMLAQTEVNLSKRLSSCELLQQDVQRLQVADNCFDLVMGAHVLEHLPDVDQGLSEMVRVAKPGAPILLIITRRGLASAWLHLIWRIEAKNSPQVTGIFKQMGLDDVRLLRFRSPIWCNWMSIAIVGNKPYGK